jgi:hypothetical protein
MTSSAVSVTGPSGQPAAADAKGVGGAQVPGPGAAGEATRAVTAKGTGGPTCTLEQAVKDPASCPSARDMPLDQAGDRLTRAEALAWWPYRPVLRAEQTSLSESLLAFDRDFDPRSQSAALLTVYEKPPNTSHTRGFWGVVDNGGIAVHVQYAPPGSEVRPYPENRSRIVDARGRRAQLVDIRRPRDNVDWTLVTWSDTQSNGGTLVWTISCSPQHYSDDALLAFVNGLTEQR